MDTLFSFLKRIEFLLLPSFRKLPHLPQDTNELLVKAWPLLSIFVGILQLLATYSLWRAGHITNAVINKVDQLANRYGYHIAISHLGFFYWLSLVLLAVDALIFLGIYTLLKRREELGWRLLFLAMLINVCYGIVATFDHAYGGPDYLISSLLGSLLGLYVLYEVRSAFISEPASSRRGTKSKKITPIKNRSGDK